MRKNALEFDAAPMIAPFDRCNQPDVEYQQYDTTWLKREWRQCMLLVILNTFVNGMTEWDQPGDNLFSGVKKSAKEVFQMVGGMFEITANTLALTEVKVLAVNGNRVACLLHCKAAHPLGNSLDVDNIDVYTVEDGKIVKAIIYSADLQKENLFWSR